MVNSDGLKLVLASASPARLSLLRAAGFAPEVQVSGVDESVVKTDDPAELSVTLARMKAQAVAASRAPEDTRVLILGCDSVLAFDGQILGKPKDADEATARWKAMRGRQGVLHTGHHLIDVSGAETDLSGAESDLSAAETDLSGADSDLSTGRSDLSTGRSVEAVGKTVVHFADVTDAEIAAYVASEEPLYVAGAFTIDGLGGAFVERIEGDHGNVVGLSLPLLRRLLGSFDLTVPQLWAAQV